MGVLKNQMFRYMTHDPGDMTHGRHDNLKFGNTCDVERVPGKFINGAGGPYELHHHRLVNFFRCYLKLEAFVELCSQLSQKMTLCPGPP